MMQEVKTDNAQSDPGLLSQAIVTDSLIFTAGFVYAGPDGVPIIGSIEQKLERIMLNVKNVLEAAGSDLTKVVKATIYVTDITMLAEINKHWPSYFGEVLPAREAVCVQELPLKAKIEISVVAVR